MTKAEIAPSGSATWSAGDCIVVWDQVSGEYKTFVNKGEGGKEVTFTFEAEPDASYDFTKAVYPASVVKETGNIDSPLVLPGSYTREEAASARLFPMIATVRDNTLEFKHLGALVHISVEGIPSEASKLVLSSRTVSLSGDFVPSDTPIDEGLPKAGAEDMNVIEAAMDTRSAEPGPAVYEIQAYQGSSFVSVDISDRSSNVISVYLPLPVGVYPYTVSLKDAGDAQLWSMSTSSVKEIRRATLYGMKKLGAQLSGGDGSAGNPFIISSAEDLVSFQSLLEADESYRSLNYKLSADIDMGAIPSFKPVGTGAESSFTGVFDGDGHVIRNLSVNSSSYAALFGYLGGKVRNIGFEGATIRAAEGNYAAVVAAVLDGDSAAIENCRVDAESSVIASGNSAGSIAGFMRNGLIDACCSNASITAGTYCAGGIVGYIQASSAGHKALVINCVYSPVYKDGKMFGASLQAANANAFIGGIAGSASCSEGKGNIKLVNCFAYPLEMKVAQEAGTVVQRVGGIAGYAGSGAVPGILSVKNCLTPVTYSNVIVGGTRLNAKTYSSCLQTAAVLGAIPFAGVVLDRLFSTYTWNKGYYLPSGTSVSASNTNFGLGDTNLRGFGTATVGSAEYSEASGGIAAALNSGVAEWNASSNVPALEWAYDSTWGYPLPVGVANPGTVTKKVSLLGDSISTYQGFMFSDNSLTMNKWYPDSGNTYDGQILNEQQTWWWKLIYEKMSNARLEVSNAFSGTAVSYIEGRTEHQLTTNSFQRRAYLYGFGAPDVLIYYGGRNDFGSFGSSSDVNLGSYTTESLETAWNSSAGVFFDNYSQGSVGILRDFHAGHPSAKVLLIMHDQMSDGYEQAARAIVDFLAGKGLDIRFVNLHKTGTRNTTNTDIGVTKEGGTHPNSVGATNIVNYVWSQAGSWLDE
ncbi:MAG: hypothetical protein J6Y31_06755 [Bacteroidales bacterium]|nr:hypothetical protein [Bacteroidales bacterium]